MEYAFGFTTTTIRCCSLNRWTSRSHRFGSICMTRVNISSKCRSSNRSMPSKMLRNSSLTFKTPPHITKRSLYKRSRTYMRSFEWVSNNPLSSLVQPRVIVPDENKPVNLSNISHLGSIPVIDMSNNDNEALVLEVSRACEKYGIFQVINHGIPKELCQKVLDVITQLFNLSSQEKAIMLSPQHNTMKDGKFVRYYIKDVVTNEKILMWGEAFLHTWHPLDPCFIHNNLPSSPLFYREIVAEYVNKVVPLITRILSLISQSLGLDQDYLQKRFGENPQCTAQANYYPPSPNPELTLGLRDHTDLKILTILLQDEGVTGLQILKDGKWFGVAPKPGALVVNVADQLQVLSNDRYKSVCHRAVNNKTMKRASFAMFMGPQDVDGVGPISELIDEHNNPALYRNYTFGEYMAEYHNQQGKQRSVKEVFKLIPA